MNQHSKPSNVQGLLAAARFLADAGRTDSAAFLRQGLERERVLAAACRSRTDRDGDAAVPRSTSVRAVTVLDEFSTNSFADAFHNTALLPDHWRAQFEEARPQIFFCESAWSGADSQQRPWKGKIYASTNFPKENRGILLEILAHCRKKGIPTVFWNKEDPTHYSDRIHDFVKTATEFDHVFTTAVECVERYKADYGLKSVHALPFATNPALFNPIDTGSRSDAVTFAGSWYANHLERSEHMHDILRGLRAAGYDLEIYNRYHGDGDPLHAWPSEYTPFVRPAVPHDQIADAYKSSRLALNINTVTQSRTMFARRVFELMSCNTLVLSNYSVGVEDMFGSDVIFCDSDPQRLATLSGDDIDAIRERNLTQVLAHHTYRHRWEEILTRIGFAHRPAAEDICVVWPVHKLGDAEIALGWFQQEADLSRDQLLLMAMDAMEPLEIATLYEKFNRYGITVTSLHHAETLAIEGRYAPVETDHIALIEPEALPPPGWLARARLHLQYAAGMVIEPAKEPQLRYKTQTTPGASIILSSQTVLSGLLAQTTKFYAV
ncbi:Spore maturation protein CgeB [Roseovarius lutimaris]|uniref:Spore maturation protein CgeB n=1 Tax=Roseovarius lutimaris TaxID=1005928 RepID=A0A1I5GMX7_9RHOB|nr:glycosyltransferase [Roseovarius lutimaris]SFO37414.1 Spore maturation protein CgeB [Roseovarius lutimaris]